VYIPYLGKFYLPENHNVS